MPDQAVHSRRILDRSYIYFVIPCLVFLFAITSHSFWIDEAYTASIASEPTLRGWWQQVFGQKTSDLQMPLYTLWIWGCEKIVGSSELALRAVNMFWFLPSLFVIAHALKGNRSLRLAAFMTAALSPFAWYYLNEARSYAMQFSTSLILYAVIYHWSKDAGSSLKSERWWTVGFVNALIFLCGSSLLSMVFAATPILATLVLLPRPRLMKLGRDFRFIWAVTFFVLLFLGLYYLWTLRIGARGTDVATTDWRNPFFICYELFGFAGLGPGRLEIRGAGFEVFKPYTVILVFYSVMVAVLLLMAVNYLRRQLGVRKQCGVIFSVVAPVGFVLVASSVLHFRVLGRHFAAVAPVAFFLLALGIAVAWRRGKMGKMLVIIFFALYLGSALSLRFGTRHQKDDYRTAALFAKTALRNGKTVWWNADRMAAWYYHVPLAISVAEQQGRALLIVNPAPETIATLGPADLIICSRPDVYDGQGTLAEFIRQSNFAKTTNMVAFSIWEQSSK